MNSQPEIAEVSGVKIRLGEHISKSIQQRLLAGTYEQDELCGLRAKLTPDDVVMELGAGVGFLSTYCAKIVGSDKVYSFEANPSLKPVISDTYALNKVSPKLEISILGDRLGERTFYVQEDFWESSLVPSENVTKEITVPAKPFNNEARRIQPTLLIMDIEGGEYELFQFIEFPSVQKIVIELHPEEIGIDKTRFVVSKLYERGFQADRASSSGNVLSLEKGAGGELDTMTETEAITNLLWSKVRRSIETVQELVPKGDAIILVDQYHWPVEAIADYRRFYFCDRNGEDWGAPADDASAIAELERLRSDGAKWLIFVWPAFWWLEHYQELGKHLHSKYELRAQNDCVTVFNLRDR